MTSIDELDARKETLLHLRGLLALAFALPFAFALRESQWLELVHGDVVDDLYDWTCLSISGLGLAIRAYTAGSHPSDTTDPDVRADRRGTLNTLGAHAFVRHPLCVGNFFIFLGLCLTPASWWLAALGVTFFVFYYRRAITAEEASLRRRHGPQFERWRAEVPAFFPNPSRPSSAATAFCWRTALRKECPRLLAVVTCFAAVDYLEDLAALGAGAVELELETTALLWLAGAFCGAIEGLTGSVQPYTWLGAGPGEVPASLSLGYYLREHWVWSTLMSGGLLLVGGLALDQALRRSWRRAPYPAFHKGVAWASGFPERAYNFGVVKEDRIYRSARPDVLFIRYLWERYGVTRVIALNGARKNEYQEIARELGIEVVRLRWPTSRLPSPRDLAAAQRQLRRPGRTLVHCSAGRDRTGFAIASYRVHHESWTPRDARHEMLRYGHRSDEKRWCFDALRAEERESPR